ncbi:aspartate/glutamate racemase family protein [Endozoicomonas sp. G2_2]|uniref:aspartate/glutamate racemase family protein n=1 Tax=Endozoicomonas sp. G2_2 TaxID=2821092 RepID=UPI001AD9ACF9|nr:aspartate/glutamate racemase family protein [Endozoicomonas sp. G2_2]MBO9471818.1 aspartate/glutamate racemase family protein [Endozoicomonas sp. G2_2]
MHIGLIGGLGPAATVNYYRELISRTRERDLPLELTMAHANVNTLLNNQARGDATAQLAVYRAISHRLRAAGATSIVIPAIGGHFCFTDESANLPLPIIDAIDAVNDEIKAQHFEKIGILGTRSVMTSALYGRISKAEVVHLPARVTDHVHEAYVSMATRGYTQDDERSLIENAYDYLVQQEQVDTVILGGTDLSLVFDGQSERTLILDCAEAHLKAIVRELQGSEGQKA